MKAAARRFHFCQFEYSLTSGGITISSIIEQQQQNETKTRPPNGLSRGMNVT